VHVPALQEIVRAEGDENGTVVTKVCAGMETSVSFHA
jgi:hypothetical protein